MGLGDRAGPGGEQSHGGQSSRPKWGSGSGRGSEVRAQTPPLGVGGWWEGRRGSGAWNPRPLPSSTLQLWAPHEEQAEYWGVMQRVPRRRKRGAGWFLGLSI